VYRPDRKIGLLTGGPGQRFSIDPATLDDIGLEIVDSTAALPLRIPRQRQVVVSEGVLEDPQTADQLASWALDGTQVIRLSDYYERRQRRVLLDAVDESWFLFDSPLRPRPVYSAFKTVTDYVAGLIGAFFVLLVIPFVWLAVRWDDGGPVFFRQERVGLHGHAFNIWKFRTMRVDAEAEGPVWASATDDRATRVGRVLRRTRLDELPQFFNILCGQMSLIGPRPERPVFVRTLGRAIAYYDRRHMTKPGVTGWATVRFGYGDSINDKWRSHAYDLYYLKHRSILLDLEILFRTALVMVLRRGQ
jgi:lipopolysaccharide/colanic/teichoic acid biosynthesis glycosyltransferase